MNNNQEIEESPLVSELSTLSMSQEDEMSEIAEVQSSSDGLEASVQPQSEQEAVSNEKVINIRVDMASVSQNFDTWKAKLDKQLHEKNSFTDALAKAEESTGVRRLYIVLGLIAIVALWLMLGYGAQILCQFLGFVYPAYASVKAIESTDKDDDTKWLVYWVVYSAFALVEFFADIFLFWIPFYWFLKCVFLFYCMAPTSWNGSIFIYTNLIRPFVLKHQKKVDQALDKAKDAAETAFNETEDAATEALKNAAKAQLAGEDTAKID